MHGIGILSLHQIYQDNFLRQKTSPSIFDKKNQLEFIGIAGSGSKHGVVDRTVIDCRKNQLGRMADFPPLLASSVFKLSKHDVPQIAFQTMRYSLMNFVNTTFFEKYVNP